MVTHPHLLVVRLRDPRVGTGGRIATESALLAQTYADWTRVDGPAGPLPAGLFGLPADPVVPDDAADVVVVTVPDGAVLVPDALARIADAARTGARLVTWDLDADPAPGDPAPAGQDGSPAANGVVAAIGLRWRRRAGRPADGLPGPRPLLRFGWSPEALLSADYPHGLVALRLEDYRAAAAAVPGGVPLCTWSLLLHLPVDLEPTVHLALPLARVPAPAEVDDGTARAVVDAGLRWRGVPARCERSAGTTRLRWTPDRWPTVTVIVPTRHNEPMLGPLLETLRLTEGPRFDVIVVDNGGRTPEHEAWYERDHGFPLRVNWWEETPFHYGRVNNAAVAQTGSDVVVLLNDDTRVLDPGWLAELVGLATMPGVGVAGTALLDADGKLQHAGVWLGLGGFAGHLFGGLRPGDDTLLGPTSWYRNTLAVTAACLAVRREHYLQVGGLDELMVMCGSDVTLGLDQVALGRRNVCSPLPGVSHLESVTRSSAPLNDQLVSLVRYQPWHDAGDPYGNPRLSLRSVRPRLRADGETDPVADVRTRLGVSL
ncbi:MAG TPA: glycosyltransferase [Kineosporiaceae bacterium]|nr:glycosyltransferase [Kineosporiaceae bacterium]